ncbi:MAG: hypothetical protein CL910_13140 [Deltaproteobacteria bacterium]|jgi:Fe-S-cluster containining protein|nr:hypothetical protein [Deltaproteobacteria bacterium]
MDDLDRALRTVEAIHSRVDARARALARRHRGRLQCRRGCHACCVDDLTVFEVEAERIRRAHGALLATGRLHPTGGCAFLDEDGGCRIYGERPYVCRTQGLPLRWLSEDRDEIVESRGICELNREGPPLGGLDEEACWTVGPVELELGRLQEGLDGGRRRRVALRSLFGGSSSGDGSADS